jgi:hypothetical protein
MSAVLSHRWSIGPEVDISNKTAEQLDTLWKSSMGEVDVLRSAYLRSLRWNSFTEPLDYYTEFDIAGRIMTRKRQFIDAAAAQEWSSWLDQNLPTSFGGWSRIDSAITDNATLVQKGRYLI